jgi:hypothetical protein
LIESKSRQFAVLPAALLHVFVLRDVIAVFFGEQCAAF